MAKHSAICESDGVMFTCDKSFSRHKLLHLQETNECPICKKEFSTQCYVDQYIKDVHSEKTHACDHCDKSFSRKHDLKFLTYFDTHVLVSCALNISYSCQLVDWLVVGWVSSLV